MEDNGTSRLLHLFPELRCHISSFLSLNGLKAYSLCCRAFNADSQFSLWHSVAINPCRSTSGLDHFISFLLGCPRRAGRIRSLSFYEVHYDKWHPGPNSSPPPPQGQPKPHTVPTHTPFLTIKEAFSHLRGLKRLKMGVDLDWFANGGEDTLVPYPKALYDALLECPATVTLEMLIVREPPQILHLLLSTFSNIANLSNLSKLPTLALPPSALLKLRRVHGDSTALSWLALNNRVNVVEFVMSHSSDRGPFTFGSTLRCFTSLRKLSYVGKGVYDAVNGPISHKVDEPINHLAHPTLEELELALDYGSREDQPPPSLALLLLSVISPTFLNSFPSLRFLHIGHFHEIMARRHLLVVHSGIWNRLELDLSLSQSELEVSSSTMPRIAASCVFLAM
ncbi:hypothetical protein DL93DRAFT_2161650 [Clavulina sp. PMI_390]|nr:hypothetical protein DL93DRAFT_2161650 [Clavulina sp. PMI_390]